MNVSFCADGSEFERRVRSGRLCLRYRLFRPCIYYVIDVKEFSFNYCGAFLLSILLNRKSNKYINESRAELSKARQHLVQARSSWS